MLPRGTALSEHLRPRLVALGKRDLQPVVDDHERVDRVVHDLVVDRDAVQVLLQDRPKVGVLLLQPALLLVDRSLVQQRLVEALEEPEQGDGERVRVRLNNTVL